MVKQLLRLEAERYLEARSMPMRDIGRKNGGDLMRRIVSRENMVQAYKQVRKNGGAPGIDGMTLDGMKLYLSEHYESLIRSIEDGTYRPLPVRRVEIPKPDGGVRLLGVPTVIDRMVQQAVAQVLTPIFERTFSENSYGFRPGRSARQAIRKARDLYNEGYRYVVDLDLSKYFDTINHELLLNMVREEVHDKAVIRLIKQFLKSGVMVNGVLVTTESGSPQGGPLSPLLSNIYLTKFDKEMEKRGHKFVRYADDVNVYVRSRRSAQRVLASCKQYLEAKLKLKVNEKKSEAGSPLKLKFLGFSLYPTKGGKASIRIHEKDLYDNTAIIVCSDHGARVHKYSRYSLEMTFMIKPFNRHNNEIEICEKRYSGIDLLPTVLDYALGDKADFREFTGVSALRIPDNRERTVYVRYKHPDIPDFMGIDGTPKIYNCESEFIIDDDAGDNLQFVRYVPWKIDANVDESILRKQR